MCPEGDSAIEVDGLANLSTLTVRDLLLDEGSCWNVELIRRTFSQHSANEILKLRAVGAGAPDLLFWPLESSGAFSVKSIHKALVEQRLGAVSPLSSAYWNCIWKIKVHKKVETLNLESGVGDITD